jgi:hypothetical protein
MASRAAVANRELAENSGIVFLNVSENGQKAKKGHSFYRTFAPSTFFFPGGRLKKKIMA